MIAIDWLDGPALPEQCPACATLGPKRARLAVESPSAGRRLTLLECPACAALFYDHSAPARYEGDGDPGALAFYVEQGAGIDVMLAPLFRVPPERVRRYLEVGCSFGYTLDFARSALGWEARGIDPSPIAAAGRRALGVDITPAYLTRDTANLGGPFDLVLSAEVIEHVPDPRAFAEVLAAQVADDGALAITTPNAAAVRQGAPGAMLLSALSPGHHLVLFSPAALEAVLRAAGLRHVLIWEQPSALCAVASRQPYPVRAEAVVDRARYRRYLVDRADTTTPETPIGLGFAYRLFKECVNAPDPAGARAAFERVRVGYQRLHGLDPARPRRLAAGAGAAPRDFDGFARAYPFNLAGVLFFRGILALNHESDPAAALDFFRAAERGGAAVRSALLSIDCDDGETEHLTWQARLHALYCLAGLDPGAAVDQLIQIQREGDGVPSPSPERAPVPRELGTAARLELFVRLVNGGHYAEADRLADGVAESVDLPDLHRAATEPPGWAPERDRALSSLFCLGILTLNHRAQFERAARLFELVHALARAACRAEPSLAGAPPSLLWPSRYCQARALKQAAALQECEAVVRTLVDHRDPALPPIPRDVLAAAEELRCSAAEPGRAGRSG